MTTIQGTIKRITFHNPENYYSVLVLDDSEGDELVVVGNITAPAVGETLSCMGKWERSKWGEQFKIESCEKKIPTDPEALVRYLGSGVIAGIGPALAERIVDHFGIETLEVMTGMPRRLLEVPGIGKSKFEKIAASWARQGGLREIGLFLSSHGIRLSLAGKILECYGANAVSVCTREPYRLVRDIEGVGFQTADAIAMKSGISPASPERIEAGILHAMYQASMSGHACLPCERLIDETGKLLNVNDRQAIDQALGRLGGDGGLVLSRSLDGSDMVFAYLSPNYRAECESADLLAALLGDPSVGDLWVSGVDARFRETESAMGISFAPEQAQAVRSAFGSSVSVITGGPGTGKSTLLKALVDIAAGLAMELYLAAPTGRAAKRMSQASGMDAMTIHRLLEYNPGTGEFLRNQNNQLDRGMVIVDEASMIDLRLLHSLLKAVAPGSRLVFIGDINQLPPVGIGFPLDDIISSGAIPVVTLQRIFRQADESDIIINAYRINNGEMITGNRDNRDFFFMAKDEPADILSLLGELVTARLPAKYGIDPLRDIQVLSPMKKNSLGVIELNRHLQELFHAGKKGVTIGYRVFHVNDKVMQVKNDYERDVYNGDIGYISKIKTRDNELVVTFDGRAVVYDYSEVDQIEHAYAVTIHKSQGSEFPVVIIPLHGQHHVMLQRNLLYTAVTRGKELVVIIGSPRAVDRAVTTATMVDRTGLFRQRIKDSPGL